MHLKLHFELHFIDLVFYVKTSEEIKDLVLQAFPDLDLTNGPNGEPIHSLVGQRLNTLMTAKFLDLGFRDFGTFCQNLGNRVVAVVESNPFLVSILDGQGTSM